jgi:hypothetical protein
MQIIGVNGFKRSGKGETANAISSVLAEPDFGFQVTQQIGFADKLKIMAARALGYVNLTDAESIALMDEFKETGFVRANGVGIPTHDITGRQYLQWFGGEARKVFGSDFWVDQVLPQPSAGPLANSNRMRERYSGIDTLVITDLRYPNEAERVLALGGEVWEVIRPGLTSDGHDSEIPLARELVTRQIQNAGDLMALRYEVERAL